MPEPAGIALHGWTTQERSSDGSADRFSPQEYSRWADDLTRLIQVSTSEGTTDGPYVYFQERITCGWISWRADLTFGSRIPDPALLRRGHVTLFQIVQQRPLRESVVLHRRRRHLLGRPAVLRRSLQEGGGRHRRHVLGGPDGRRPAVQAGR